VNSENNCFIALQTHDEVSDKMICVLRQSSSHVHQFIETSFTKKKKIKD
jgi:hypothetical protein